MTEEKHKHPPRFQLGVPNDECEACDNGTCLGHQTPGLTYCEACESNDCTCLDKAIQNLNAETARYHAQATENAQMMSEPVRWAPEIAEQTALRFAQFDQFEVGALRIGLLARMREIEIIVNDAARRGDIRTRNFWSAELHKSQTLYNKLAPVKALMEPPF